MGHGSKVVVYFWASWCAPCKPLRASLEAWGEKYGVALAGVCVEDDKGAVKKHDVRFIPTLVFLRGGVEVKRFVGVPHESEFTQALAEAYSDGDRNQRGP